MWKLYCTELVAVDCSDYLIPATEERTMLGKVVESIDTVDTIGFTPLDAATE